MAVVSEKQVPEGYVCLVSSDGFEFLVEKDIAVTSSLVERTLKSGFLEARTRRIELFSVSGICLEYVCKYFFYKLKYKNTNAPKPEFDIPLEITVELMMAANYLDL